MLGSDTDFPVMARGQKILRELGINVTKIVGVTKIAGQDTH